MARRPRNDSPGTWFHIVNRGIARRTLFERSEDMAVFLDHLGAACTRGEIEVHAYALMTTHYHLLVLSPQGTLAVAMQRVQTEYSRWFNRARRRDGSLVRGRYTSKEVDTLAYRRAVVSYIDRNPVSAGLVPRAGDYPYGSAGLYEGRRTQQGDWLERRWVEDEVSRTLSLSTYDASRYSEVFGRLPEELARVVEARLNSRGTEDPLDDLIDAAPARVLEWMKRKAMLADGTRPGLPLFSPRTLEDAIDVTSGGGTKEWTIGRRCGWLVLRVGLTRQLCGLGLDSIAERVRLSRSAVSSIAHLHAQLLESDSEYADRASAVASRAFGVWKGGGK